MVYDLDEIQQIAKQLLEERKNQSVWCFKGELGSGKTTLIKSLCQELNVVDGVSSPSFSIVNEYESEAGLIIYHFDFFRLEDEMEAIKVGVTEYFDSGELCFIEWPEMVENLLPDKYLEINIKLVEQNQRELRITAHVGEN